MKRWVFRAGIGVAIGVALVYIVGASLPVQHTASLTRVVDAPPDRVWAVLMDVQSYPDWRPDVDSVEVLGVPGGRRSWIEHGRGETIPFAAEVEAPPRRLVTRIDTDELPFGGKWTTDIVPEGQGSAVTITEDGEVSNPIYRFISRFLIGHDATIRAFLDALDARLG